MPGRSVTTFGMYVSGPNWSTGPTSFHGWSCFSKTGPRAKPSAGSAMAETATAPATLAAPVMNRRRVTVSPSKAPGIRRSVVYLDLICRRSAICGEEPYSRPSLGALPARDAGPPPHGRHVAASLARGGSERGGRGARARARVVLGRPQRGRRPPPDRGHARVPHRLGEVVAPLGVPLGAQRDDVGELADRGEVAEGGQAGQAARGGAAGGARGGQPEGVEPVARQEGEVAVVGPDEAGLAVVQEVAL